MRLISQIHKCSYINRDTITNTQIHIQMQMGGKHSSVYLLFFSSPTVQDGQPPQFIFAFLLLFVSLCISHLPRRFPRTASLTMKPPLQMWSHLKNLYPVIKSCHYVALSFILYLDLYLHVQSTWAYICLFAFCFKILALSCILHPPSEKVWFDKKTCFCLIDICIWKVFLPPTHLPGKFGLM